MGNNVSTVLTGKPLVTGGILTAPAGTALPTDAGTALNAAFLAAGYVTEDGVTENVERTIDKIKAWGLDTIAVTQTDFEGSFEFAFAQFLDPVVNKAVYGDANVTVTNATTTAGTKLAIKVNGSTVPRKAYCFEIRDGLAKVRIVVPNGQLTPSGEVTYNDSDVAAYSCTLDPLPDASGNIFYKYTDDGVFSA